MVRKDRWPELPPDYRYERQGACIFISFLRNGIRRRIGVPTLLYGRYWKKPENAALAAWKHAYEQLKEGVR